jgi:hypothetical protein
MEIAKYTDSTPTAHADEKHAILLASKSNYQNILEGTHVPGVTYSAELTSGLTSKRTSHKIAEQGRRNRINMALQEMQQLLPSPTCGSKKVNPANTNGSTAAGVVIKDEPGNEKSPTAEGKSSGGAQQANSKAATVELAIDYIKQLKSELGERDKEIESRDKEVEELKKKLEEMKRILGESSSRSSMVMEEIPEENTERGITNEMVLDATKEAEPEEA